jgi:hypothetical protein
MVRRPSLDSLESLQTQGRFPSHSLLPSPQGHRFDEGRDIERGVGATKCLYLQLSGPDGLPILLVESIHQVLDAVAEGDGGERLD